MGYIVEAIVNGGDNSEEMLQSKVDLKQGELNIALTQANHAVLMAKDSLSRTRTKWAKDNASLQDVFDAGKNVIAKEKALKVVEQEIEAAGLEKK